MKVEIYENMSYSDYEKIDAVRQSWLGYLSDSPAHLRWHIDHVNEEESDALRVGSAVDTAVFFPEEFARTYVAAPVCDKRTKEGKAVYSQFEFENQGKTILKPDEFRDVVQMCSSICKMKTAMTLLASSLNQLVVVWRDEASGVKCKARLDGWHPVLKVAYDLKTSRNVRLFRKSLFDFGYHRQAAFYTQALHAAGLKPESFCFIVVDKSPPHGVMIFRLRDEDVRLAWLSCQNLLCTYANCMRTNTWPGYPDAIQDIELAEWMREKEVGGLTYVS